MFDRIFFIFAGNKDNHKVSNEFEIWPDPNMDCGVICPWPSEKFSIDLYWEKCCDHSSAFIFNWNIFILAGNKNMYRSLEELEL